MIIEFWKTGENPITCYESIKTTGIDTKRIKKTIRKNNHNLRAVTFISKEGIKSYYDSVVQASEQTGVDRGKIYLIINGKIKNKTAYQIFKTEIQ
jgi:hypothetical protein